MHVILELVLGCQEGHGLACSIESLDVVTTAELLREL